ncbi:MAG TPA: DUF3592 domain-containing protein [Candidatus Ozemobacteraceae bacterium]|nr:DUF3592 domain-containing protein [Candidatus Ozemobacteraceae bacterium]
MSNRDVISGAIRDSGLIFLVLGTVFLLVGILLLIIGGVGLYEQHRSGSWKPVPAVVEKVDWHEEDRDDGTAYSVTGTYRYEWEGKTYRSERIAFSSGSSSDRSSWQPIYDSFKMSRDSGTPITVYVDPEAPANAVVSRDVTMGMILFSFIGSIFFTLGTVFAAAGVWSYLQKRAPADPHRPWIGDGPWQGFQIRSGDWVDVLLSWVMAICVSLFASIFVFLMLKEPSTPLPVKGFLGIFVLVAALLLYNAMYITMRRLKYGDSILLLSQMPLVPGTPFDAVVVTKRALKPEDGCKATLRCVAVVRKEKSTGTGKKVTYTEEIMYEKSVIVRVDLNAVRGDRSAIPVHFEIPGHIPPRILSVYPQIRWRLVLEAETAGIDYFAEFDLPVYLAPDPTLIQYRTTET